MDALQALHPSDQTLQAYGLSQLDRTTANSVDDHLKTCPECRSRVNELSTDSAAQGRNRKGPGSPAMSGSNPPQFESSLENAGHTPSSAAGAGSTHPGLAGHPDYEIIRELGAGRHGRRLPRQQSRSWTGSKSSRSSSSQLMNRRGVADRFLARDPQRGQAPSPQHRHRLLDVAVRRQPRLRHGIRRRATTWPEAGQGPGAAAGRPRVQLRPPGGAGPPARARARHGPPRHQAEQPDALPQTGSGRWSRSSTSAWPRSTSEAPIDGG